MSAGDIGAAVGGGVGLVVAAVLVWAVLSLRRAVDGLERAVEAARGTAEEVRDGAVPLLGQMREIASRTEGELARMDDLLQTASSISVTVDSASRLAYLAFSNPVIKALAFASGTGRAVSRLRRRREDGR
ncbi:MAG TPA: hypothetical protein VFA11_03695 [Acidimicrobiales bacterium]|nr:hypothetical protein [Acidimicrobiales bacterium]